MINIDIDTRDLLRVVNELDKVQRKVPAITSRALGRTITHANKVMSQAIREEYVIKAGDIKEHTELKKASKTDLNAFIKVTGRPLALSRFQLTPKKPQSGNRRRKVKVKIKRGGRKTEVRTDPGAFIQEMNGAVTAFRRVDKRRFPVVPIKTLSIPQMASNDGVLSKVESKAQEKLIERMNHEISREVRRAQRNHNSRRVRS